MKLIDLIIIFVLITMPFQMLEELKSDYIDQAAFKRIEMNRIIDTAAIDGAAVLIKSSDKEHIEIDKDKCISTFYNTLLINLNILDDDYAKAKIMAFIPVIAIVDYDGFYLLTQETYKDETGYEEIKPIWQPKEYYTYKSGQYVYGFTLDDEVTIFDTSNKKLYKGKQKDLKNVISADLLQDEVIFDQVRRRTIIEALQNKISYYMNHHNEIAKEYGVTYKFSLPTIENDDWARTVDDIGILAFFQGMPIGIDGKYYNCYALGGAQVMKSDRYYVQVDTGSGLPYYHREDCPLLTDKSRSYNSPEQCALEGAFPCDYCKP